MFPKFPDIFGCPEISGFSDIFILSTPFIFFQILIFLNGLPFKKFSEQFAAYEFLGWLSIRNEKVRVSEKRGTNFENIYNLR